MNKSRRSRILIITRNLPPLVGGMERLNWHMAEELAKVAEVRIVGPEGSAALAPAGITVREAPLKPLWKFLWRARSLARSEARRWEPDVVLAGSGLTAPLARSAARTCRARTAAYVHGLDVAVKHPAYRAIWLPAIRRMDRIVANSHATADLCRGIGADSTHIGIVHPGVDIPNEVEPIFAREKGRGEGSSHPQTAQDVRQRYNLGNGPALLSVGRLSARKGLREFVMHAMPCIVAARPDTVLLIVGDAPSQALHAEAQTSKSIRASAVAAGIGNHIRFLGKVPDEELLALYRTADVHVFPIREIPGDPEGFGMVAVEAAAHGLPTVTFATGGVKDAVAEGKSGYFVAPEDYAAFVEAVLKTLPRREALRNSCIEFAHQFSWSRFGAQIAQQLGFVPVRDC